MKPIFFLAVFVDHLSYAFLPQFVSGLVAAEGLPQNYVAAPFTAYYLCFALALMPAGRYEARFGSRPLILGGLFLTSVALLAMAFSPTFLGILAARASAGIGQGILFIGVQSYVLAKAARENRTKANTIIVFGFQAGMISGMAIGSLLVSQILPTGVFTLGGVVAGLATFYAIACCLGSAWRAPARRPPTALRPPTARRNLARDRPDAARSRVRKDHPAGRHSGQGRPHGRRALRHAPAAARHGLCAGGHRPDHHDLCRLRHLRELVCGQSGRQPYGTPRASSPGVLC